MPHARNFRTEYSERKQHKKRMTLGYETRETWEESFPRGWLKREKKEEDSELLLGGLLLLMLRETRD